MLKCIAYLVLAVVVAALIGSGIHLYRVALKNKKEMSQYEGQQPALKAEPGKVLVVYYSMSGHTKDIAERIRKQTGADVYEIKTMEDMPKGPKLHLAVKQQLKSGNYPKLLGEMPDFNQYDMVFVGAPVWWYTMATPMYAFLQQADFQGKKVVPFSTQGSNYGSYFEDFANKAKNAKLLKPANFNNLPEKYNQAVDNKISAWLNDL